MDILFEEEGELKVIVFDATLKVVPSGISVPTEHPVERGANISDHIREENDRLTADCFVTNTPVYSPNIDGMNGTRQQASLTGSERVNTKLAKASGRDIQKAEYQIKTQTQDAQTLQFTDAVDRITIVHETLNRVRKLGLECSISTPVGTYEGMYITGVSSPKEAQGSITFTIDASYLRIVDSELVDVEPLETRAEREARLGARGTEEVDEGSISIAAQLLEGLTDINLIRPSR